MSRILIFITFFLLCSINAFSEVKRNTNLNNYTTIANAVDQALSNGKDIQKRIAELDVQRQDLYMSYASILPNVQYFYSMTHSDMAYSGSLSPLSGLNDRTIDGGMDSFSVEQNVSIHKIIPQIMYGQKNYDIAQNIYEQHRNELTLRVIATFLDVYRYEKLKKLSREAREAFEKQYEIAKIKFSHGKVTKSHLLSINAKLNEAQADEIKVTNQYEIAKNLYYFLTNSNPKNLILPSKMQLPEQDVNKFIDLALLKNTKLKIDKDSISKAKYNIAARASDLLPDVKIGYAKTKQRNIWYIAGNPDLTQDTAKLEISVPIFDSGQKILKVSKASKELTLAKINLELTTQEIVNLISTTWNMHLSQQANIDALRNSKLSAQEYYDQQKIMYINNTGSAAELFEAKKTLINAETALLNSEIEAIMLYYKLIHFIS